MKHPAPYDLFSILDTILYVSVNLVLFVAAIKYIFWG